MLRAGGRGWTLWPSYQYGILRAGGLSQGESEEDCPQPATTAERDALRDEVSAIVNSYYAQRGGGHMHEGHPDVKAWLSDLIPRMSGLKNRPKLMRCKAEARKQAREWVSTFNSTMKRIHRTVPARRVDTGEWGTGTAYNVVIPEGGITVKTYKLRDYHFRSFGVWSPAFYVRGDKPPPAGAGNGNGGTPAAPAGPAAPPYLAGLWQSLTTGELAAGVPRAAVTYGILGLLAYRFLR